MSVTNSYLYQCTFSPFSLPTEENFLEVDNMPISQPRDGLWEKSGSHRNDSLEETEFFLLPAMRVSWLELLEGRGLGACWGGKPYSKEGKANRWRELGSLMAGELPYQPWLLLSQEYTENKTTPFNLTAIWVKTSPNCHHYLMPKLRFEAEHTISPLAFLQEVWEQALVLCLLHTTIRIEYDTYESYAILGPGIQQNRQKPLGKEGLHITFKKIRQCRVW